jgi:predicted Zn finger-like uncharacterized protein
VKLSYAEELEPTPIETTQTPVFPKTIVIQCPSCSTKFSLEQEKLIGITNPQFHCSKCDHVFTANLSKTAENKDRVTSLTKPESLKIPKKTDPSFVPSPPIEGEESLSQSMPVGNKGLRASIQKSVTEPAQIEFLFGDYPSEPSYNGLCDILPIDEPKSKPIYRKELRPEELKPQEPRRQFEQVALSEAPKRKPPLSEWQSFGILLSGAVIALGVLAVFSYFVVSSPNLADALTSSESPVPAPPELIISKAKLGIVDLDNGEQVPIISGTLVNHGKTPFSEIIIRGFVFDKSGSIISKQEVSAASPLSETKIKSLSREMIGTLQSRRSIRKFSLGSGQSMPFSIAFLDESQIKDGQITAHSFATQIYSAK